MLETRSATGENSVPPRRPEIFGRIDGNSGVAGLAVEEPGVAGRGVPGIDVEEPDADELDADEFNSMELEADELEVEELEADRLNVSGFDTAEIRDSAVEFVAFDGTEMGAVELSVAKPELATVAIIDTDPVEIGGTGFPARFCFALTFGVSCLFNEGDWVNGA